MSFQAITTGTYTVFPTANDVASTTGDGKLVKETVLITLLDLMNAGKDWIVTGFDYASAAGLVATFNAGTAIIKGYYFSRVGTFTATLTASQTNHIYLTYAVDGDNNITSWGIEVNTSGTPPSTNYVKLEELVTNGSTVTGNTDQRELIPGQVASSLFDANTILAANTDNTPAAVTIAEARIVGRISGGNITGLTAAQMKTLLGYLQNISEDTTPQLGGNLDTNGSDINLGSDDAMTVTAAPGSDHEASGNKVTLTAGESLVFSDVCYIKSDGKAWKADANAADPAPRGLVVAAAVIAGDAAGAFVLPGTIIRDDSWSWTVGNPVYLSETAGAFTQSAPVSKIVLGVATHADRVFFYPSISDVPLYSYSIVEDTTPQLGGDLALNEFNVDHVAAPAVDHKASGNTVALTAGENLVFGEPCYIKSDGKAWKADANGTAPAERGLFVAVAAISADASGQFAMPGTFLRDDTWAWTVGNPVYLSETAGAFTQTAPDTVLVMGIATHADRILFYPNIQDASAGGGGASITVTADETMIAGDAVMVYQNDSGSMAARKMVAGPKQLSMDSMWNDLLAYDDNFMALVAVGYSTGQMPSEWEDMGDNIVVFAMAADGGSTTKGAFQLRAARLSDLTARPLAMGPKQSIGPAGGTTIWRVSVLKITSTTFLVVQYGGITAAVVATLDKDTLVITLGTYKEQAVTKPMYESQAKDYRYRIDAHLMCTSNSKVAIVGWWSDGSVPVIDTLTISGTTITWVGTTLLSALTSDGTRGSIKYADNKLIIYHHSTNCSVATVTYSNDADTSPAIIDTENGTTSALGFMMKVTAAGRFTMFQAGNLEFFDINSSDLITWGTKTTSVTTNNSDAVAGIYVADNNVIFVQRSGYGYRNFFTSVTYSGDTPSEQDLKQLPPVAPLGTGAYSGVMRPFNSGFLFTSRGYEQYEPRWNQYTEVDGSGNLSMEGGNWTNTAAYTNAASGTEVRSDFDARGHFAVLAINANSLTGTVYVRAMNTRTGVWGATKTITGWSTSDICVALFPDGLKGCIGGKSSTGAFSRWYIFDVNPSTLAITLDTDVIGTSSYAEIYNVWSIYADQSGRDGWFFGIGNSNSYYNTRQYGLRKDDAGVWQWSDFGNFNDMLPTLAWDREKNMAMVFSGGLVFPSGVAGSMMCFNVNGRIASQVDTIATLTTTKVSVAETLNGKAIIRGSMATPAQTVFGTLQYPTYNHDSPRVDIIETSTFNAIMATTGTRGQYLNYWGYIRPEKYANQYANYLRPINWDTGEKYEAVKIIWMRYPFLAKGADKNLCRTFYVSGDYEWNANTIEWNPPYALTGVVSADVAKGAAATVITTGEITGLAGLEVGRTYYMDRTGHRTTTQTPFYLYVATSATTAVR